MRLNRIQFPGKTLIISSGDARYQIFSVYFISLWHQRFSTRPDISIKGGAERLPLNSDVFYETDIPKTFLKQWYFFLKRRYKTVVFLNPDLRADRSLRWAARLSRVRHRAGFSPLRSWAQLNHTLPYNAENHHFVHQLKIFFEYLSGEKVADWQMPQKREELAARHIHAGDGLIAIDVAERATEHLAPQLQKLINLLTRHETCTLVIRSSDSLPETAEVNVQQFAKGLSTFMTERAIENTQLVLNPPLAALPHLVGGAEWVTGTDAELLNLAAFLSVPSLSVFGPLNERVWQPFSTRARALTGDFACRPCTAFPGKVECINPNTWQCMRDLSGELWAATLTAQRRRTR